MRARFEAEAETLRAREGRLSTARLTLFLLGAALLGTGLSEDAPAATGAGLLCVLAFAGAVALHARTSSQREHLLRRRDVHDRHLARMDGRWVKFPIPAGATLPASHPYAADIDLVGRGSLLQRIDVTHTDAGHRCLLGYLAAPADRETALSRQAAVAELADDLPLRQELEATARTARGDEKIDGSRFAAFASLPSLFEAQPALRIVVWALPVLTAATWLAGQLGALPRPAWLAPLTIQVGLLIATGRRVRAAFDLVGARQGVLEAFEGMLREVGAHEFQTPLLRAIGERLRGGGKPAAAQVKRLQGLASYAMLREQFLLWAFVNPLLLWDLHVLRALERWNAEVGSRTSDWMAALGELEALCSLASLCRVDPKATFPELTEGGGLSAEDIAHPLLRQDARVANSVEVAGPGAVVVVTGSNMAGKSTLLRAVGLNVALAFAGGPVCARSMRVAPVRLRASMRASDELQEGASYFHAELTKLRSVVDEADASPPVFFLLDELLRGTNERARHVGARAVVEHLVRRGAMGLVATHDVALAALGDALAPDTTNLHFTDVVVDGEMRFDYRLRPGIVKTSNALRLLAMVGIEVPEDERRALESPRAADAQPSGGADG